MDPKVCGKLLTLNRRGYDVDVEALRDRFPLRQIAGKGPKMGQKVAAVEKWFRGSPWFLGYESIYRRKKYVGGATSGPRGWGARLPPWARPPASWPPCGVPDFNSKSCGLLSVQERSPRRFHSVWIPFDIPFMWNTKIGKKNKTGIGPPFNRLVPKII